MKFFLDSANFEEIKQVAEWGLLDGVTTNPTLATKAGVDFKTVAPKILELVEGPVSLEVLSTDVEGMVKEGQALAQLGDNVVVKLPTTVAGLQALRQLRQENIAVNMTLVFSQMQALAVAKQGATYVSPFIGRIDDISPGGGLALVADIVSMYQAYGFTTQVLAASIRTIEHIEDSAVLGVDVATIPFKLMKILLNHKLTDQGLQRFISDWKQSGQEALVEV